MKTHLIVFLADWSLKSHFNSLTINEFAEKNNINIKTVEKFFNKLVSLKQLCKISEKRYFLPKTILKCANVVEKNCF